MYRQERKNMEGVKSIKEVDEEALAEVKIWEYELGVTPMAVVKCVIELGKADVLESHGGSMTLSELSATLGCSSSVLRRIMRYLVHRGFFKQKLVTSQESSISYVQTALSHLLIKDGGNNTNNNNSTSSMAALVLLQSSPAMLAPWHMLSSRASARSASAIEGADRWDAFEYASANSAYNNLFNDGMASHTRLAIARIVDLYPEAFEGIGSLVDVGGGDGTAVRTLVNACPWIRCGVNFDLPHVVSVAPQCGGIEHVGGNMFEVVPKADVAFLKWVLHDWGDDDCIPILKKCREAIPEDTGKVIIAEAVIDETEEGAYTDIHLAMDMAMLVHSQKGKESTLKEWECVVKAAGFSRFTVKHIQDVVSVIEAYP